MIKTIHLFPKINKKLIRLLKSLSGNDWNRKTILPSWTIRDIASHLLDVTFRKISSLRDNHRSRRILSFSNFKNSCKSLTKLADEWAQAFDRISPGIIIELLEHYLPVLYNQLKKMDLMAEAENTVSWAGEKVSKNWFDLAREYTEHWHHQMQIRDCLNDNTLLKEEFYSPVLTTFMTALPYHYNKLKFPENYKISIRFSGLFEISFTILRNNGNWVFTENHKDPDTQITISHNHAWKILTKAYPNKKSKSCLKIKGDKKAGEHISSMKCIMI